jgi:hypothetical protein
VAALPVVPPVEGRRAQGVVAPELVRGRWPKPVVQVAPVQLSETRQRVNNFVEHKVERAWPRDAGRARHKDVARQARQLDSNSVARRAQAEDRA